MVRRYFPRVDLNELSDEQFAELTGDAAWLHSQMVEGMVAGVATAMGAVFGGGNKEKPKSPPRRPGRR